MVAREAGRSARILITDYAWPSLEIERQILGAIGAELVVADSGDPAELIALAPEADGILSNWKRLPAEAVEAADRCVVISRYGVGVDNIPVDTATSLGIVVTNVPGFCVNEVADHAMALLLACARRVVKFAGETSRGRWHLLASATGLPRLNGQTLGLVGFGRIAQAMVPRARGFGMRILVYTPRLAASGSGDVAEEVEVTASLDELLARSDYVSLHAPATADAHGLIGPEQLARMKPTAYLINTSRGALIDEEALAAALDTGQIAGAGLDVLVGEPPDADRALLRAPNAIVTPHAAFYSDLAITELQTSAAHNIAAVMAGSRPEHVVNPEVLGSPKLRMGRS